MKTLDQYFLENCCNFRCGIVMPHQKVPHNYCDIPHMHNYSVPEDPGLGWKTPGGSLSGDENGALMGAIGETLEWYCGAVYEFETVRFDDLEGKTGVYYDDIALFSDEQYADPGFAWRKPSCQDSSYGKVYSLYDNAEIYVPHELIGLASGPQAFMPSTSTGIAAHTHTYQALLSALEEVLERDALAVTWLNSLGGREIPMDGAYLEEVHRLGGEVFCLTLPRPGIHSRWLWCAASCCLKAGSGSPWARPAGKTMPPP